MFDHFKAILVAVAAEALNAEMLFLILYASFFHFLVSTSVAFKVSAPSLPIAAGQSGTVTWTRSLLDPLTFTLTLHDAIRNIDGQAVFVTTDPGNFSGQVTFNFPDAGTFQVTSSAKLGLIARSLSSSDQFSVNNPPPSVSPPSPAGGPPLQAPPSQAPSLSPDTAASSSQTGINTTTSSNTPTSTQASRTEISTTVSSQSSTNFSSLSSSDGSTASSTRSFATIAQSSTTVPGYDMNTSTTDTSGSTSTPTTPVTATLAKSTTNIGAIVGGVLGAVAFVLFLLLVFWVSRRRRKQETEFFRDMMVRRRSQALVFSQAIVPAMGVPEAEGPVADLEDPGKAGRYEQPLAFRQDILTQDMQPLEIPSSASVRTSGSLSPVIFSPMGLSANPSSSHSLDIQHATWTHRQVTIHDKIMDLQAKLIAKQSWSLTDTMDDYDVDDLKDRITQLEQLMLSAWALGFTDETPEGLGLD